MQTSMILLLLLTMPEIIAVQILHRP